MASITAKEVRKRRRRRARLRKKRNCRFCPDGCDRSPRPVYVDYKDVSTLRLMIDRGGRLLSGHKTGNCAKYQRAVRRAVLRARFIGLLPYTAED